MAEVEEEDSSSSSSSSSEEEEIEMGEEKEHAPHPQVQRGSSERVRTNSSSSSSSSSSGEIEMEVENPTQGQEGSSEKVATTKSSCSSSSAEKIGAEEDNSNSIPGQGGSSEGVTVTRMKKKRSRPRVFNLSKTRGEEEQLGEAVFLTMSNEDVENLLQRIDSQCPIDDFKTEQYREKNIDWEKVAFSTFGARQCKSVWMFLRTKTRKFRILHEVVEELRVELRLGLDPEKHLKKILEQAPRHPFPLVTEGGFQLFCQEKRKEIESLEEIDKDVTKFYAFQRKCRKEWASLLDEEKQKYRERAELAKAEYRAKLKEYFAKFPYMVEPNVVEPPDDSSGLGSVKNVKREIMRKWTLMRDEFYPDAPPLPYSPQELYVNREINKYDEEHSVPVSLTFHLREFKMVARNKYRRLKDAQKLEWIERCVKECEKFVEDVKAYKLKHPSFTLPSTFQLWNVISPEEFKQWMEADPKRTPPRLRTTAFELFLIDFYEHEKKLRNELNDEEFMERAKATWKQLDRRKRRLYMYEIRNEDESFIQRTKEYHSALPEVLKYHFERGLPHKFKHRILDAIRSDPLVMDWEDEIITDIRGKPIKEQSRGKETPNPSSSMAAAAHNADDASVSLSDGEEGEEGGNDGVEGENAQEGEERSEGAVRKRRRTNLPIYKLNGSYERDLKKRLQEMDERMKEKRRKISSMKQKEFSDKCLRRSYERYTHKRAPYKVIRQGQITEAIRGFFDGHQGLREFSPYYYYGKHVAREHAWMVISEKLGMVKTAVRIVESFNRLCDREKKRFIYESKSFHYERFYKNIASENDELNPRLRTFPDEPKPPPKKPQEIYEEELKKKRVAMSERIPWEELDRDTHTIYIKKLHRLTKEYIEEFQRFVKNMTPNDMVEYLIAKCQAWDPYCSKRRESTIDAIESNAFSYEPPPSYALELSDDEPDPLPEFVHPGRKVLKKLCKYIPKERGYRFEKNPFSVIKSKKGRSKKGNTLVEKLCLLKERTRPATATGEERDPDLPSTSEDDDDDEEEGIEGGHRRERKLKAKLKKASRYCYPLEDFYDNKDLLNIDPPYEKVKQKPFWWLDNSGLLDKINQERLKKQSEREAEARKIQRYEKVRQTLLKRAKDRRAMAMAGLNKYSGAKVNKKKKAQKEGADAAAARALRALRRALRARTEAVALKKPARRRPKKDGTDADADTSKKPARRRTPREGTEANASKIPARRRPKKDGTDADQTKKAPRKRTNKDATGAEPSIKLPRKRSGKNATDAEPSLKLPRKRTKKDDGAGAEASKKPPRKKPEKDGSDASGAKKPPRKRAKKKEESATSEQASRSTPDKEAMPPPPPPPDFTEDAMELPSDSSSFTWTPVQVSEADEESDREPPFRLGLVGSGSPPPKKKKKKSKEETETEIAEPKESRSRHNSSDTNQVSIENVDDSGGFGFDWRAAAAQIDMSNMDMGSETKQYADLSSPVDIVFDLQIPVAQEVFDVEEDNMFPGFATEDLAELRQLQYESD